jgi:nicotinate-nucleotide adenylyltransferase
MTIGILAGTFDPVHLGHIGFIEQTIRDKKLDKVYLLLEKKPKHKAVYASYEDRFNMVASAIRSHPNIEVYDCKAENYPISRCLPKIKKVDSSAKLYLLTGQDVAEHIMSWEGAENLLDGVELVVASRDDGITSGKIRKAIANGQKPIGLETEVLEYIQKRKLYGSETISGE